MKIFLAIFVLAGFIFWNQPLLSAAELQFENHTNNGIINILVKPENKDPFYFRLDLLPHSSDRVQNPDVKAALRVDTGLQFWFYPTMNLGNISSIVFCENPAGLMEQIWKDGTSHKTQGEIQELAPQKDSRPVCNLDFFRPAMPMKDVCKILPDSLTDDNGALLTGLGYAGLVWAARLVPEHNGPVTPASVLEHLELRLPLKKEYIAKLLQTLKKQNFVPWQAEFPGQDMEFNNTSSEQQNNSYKIIKEKISAFINSFFNITHKHIASKSCEQAIIMMAPENSLQDLQNADEPQKDVQIFTIYIRPCINTLLLDVAAYRSGAPSVNPVTTQ